MSDYDNTNKGAAWPPFPDQKFILGGPLDVNGIEKQCVYISGVTPKSGKKIIRVYQELGIMFENESTNEKAPNYSGSLQDHLGEEMKLAAWKRQSEKGNYLSLSVSEKMPGGDNKSIEPESNSVTLDDEVPF
tara:strand:+ start:437 stop:832 length:396 start_codon:yes stop_codon:yes gene_type:complete